MPIGPRQQQHELLAAKPRRDVGNAPRVVYRARNANQASVALQMAGGIVQGLEVVDIDHKQGQGRPRPFREVPSRGQGVLEGASIGKACQGVGVREREEMGVRLLQLLGLILKTNTKQEAHP